MIPWNSVRLEECFVYNMKRLDVVIAAHPEVLNHNVETTNFDDTARILDYIPGLLKKFAFWLLRVLDYFGLLPMKLKRISPFHGSLFITSMASLGLPPIYHHIYNFGNVPVFIAFGAKYHKYELNRHGQMLDNKYIDTKMVIDERIADGHYFSQFLQALRYTFQHPEIVEAPPSKVVEDLY